MGWRIFLALAFVFNIQIFANENLDCNEAQGREIYFLHGIASKKEAFGSFDSFVKKIHSEQKSECVKTFFFEYDTGNNKLGIPDFSKNFSDFLKKNHSLNSNNKISIVTHSQGGLVFLNWLIDTLNGDHSHFDQSVTKSIDSFLSMSTPYYGAAIANIGLKARAYVFPFLGKIELEQMSFGSLFNYKIFKAMTDDQLGLISYLENLNFLDVGAVIPQNSFFKKYFDLKSLEGDTAVGVASSNINGIFIKDDQIKNLNLTSFYPVNAVHGKFTLLGVKSIARVPKKCVQGECSTPVMQLYKNQFFGESNFIDYIEEDISSFRVVIYLSTSSLQKKEKFDLDEISVPKRVEIDGITYLKRFKQISPSLYSLSFAGAFKDYKTHHSDNLMLKVKSANFSKIVKIPIQVGKTSNLELRID